MRGVRDREAKVWEILFADYISNCVTQYTMHGEVIIIRHFHGLKIFKGLW